MEGEPQSTREDIVCKARLYVCAPVNELVKRGWIEKTKDLDLMERRVLRFLDKESVDEPSKLAYATKKSTEKANSSQVAWVHRAKQLAKGIHAQKFSSSETFAST